MSLKSLARFFRSRRLLQRYSRYLLDGEYVLLPNLRTYILNDEHGIQECKRFLGYRTWMSLKDKLVRHFSRCRIHGGEKCFFGTAMYMNNSSRQVSRIRFFDLKASQVFVLYLDERNYWVDKNTYQVVHEPFNLPEIIHFDDSRHSYVEELVYSRDAMSEQDVLAATKRVIDMYSEYVSTCARNEHVRVGKIGDSLKLKERFNLGFDEEEYPIIPIHNDLSSNNLIIGQDDRCHVIDWEHFGDNFFFFDIFRLFINDFQMEKKNTRMSQYLLGMYDDELKRLFSSAHCEYRPTCRVSYLWRTFAIMVDMGYASDGDKKKWLSLADGFQHELAGT